jgi:hypothetical protein
MKAFPNVSNQQGMDLRDYFASDAMKGLIHHFDFATFRDDPLRVARWAYDAADAMMKAREENHGQQ